MMKVGQVRNWLGKYFLAFTALLGAYILIFSETWFLPIDRKSGMDTLQIIIPLLVGQLITIFRWYTSDQDLTMGTATSIPSWVVKWPPLLVSVVLLMAIGSMIAGNISERGAGGIDATSFKAVVTFCVSILNATTIFVIMKYFRMPQDTLKAAGDAPVAPVVDEIRNGERKILRKRNNYSNQRPGIVKIHGQARKRPRYKSYVNQTGTKNENVSAGH